MSAARKRFDEATVLALIWLLGGFGGFVSELIFRRFVHGKWINPGFLYGPLVPVYGFGLVLMFLLSSLPLPAHSALARKALQTLLIGVALTLVEYLAGLLFVRGMGLPLWNYAGQRWNVQGVICPKFSLIWAAVGGVYVLFFHSALSRAVQKLSERKGSKAFAFVVFALVFVDFLCSFAATVG